jgi:ribosomal protein S12 methylthiotransferase accessory factor
MQIQRCRGGILDEIIPSYMSRVETFYARDLPFAVYERHHWGKGMSEKQAYLSGGFELVERICAEYAGGIEMIQCPWRMVKDRAMDLRSRVGHQAYLRNVERVDADLTVDWVWGWSLSQGKALLVPASMVFLSRSVFQGKFMLNFSSGLAAGTTMEDAVLQGLMETVEHDARYIWQANAVVTPKLTGLPEAVREIEDKLAEQGFDLIVKDYTTDIGIYVFRAWIVKPDDPVRYAASGMGAGLRPEMALNRAVSEAKQAWPNHARPSDPYHASRSNADLFGYNTAALFTHYQDNRMDILGRGPERDYRNLPDLSSGNIASDVRKAMDLIARAVPDNDILVVNLTRESFGIPVVRVIASGLQNPSQPLQNFPGGRLFSVPVTLGYHTRELSYEELYNDRHQQ